MDSKELRLEDNAIYNHLKDKRANSLLSTIDDTYTICNDILKEVPKFFSNYTFHDIQHSLRDIDYMTEFVKDDLEQYSDLHLAMIILSGLLHDIGMFVSDEEKEELENEYCSEECPKGSEALKIKIQNEIRINHGKRVSKMMDITEINNGRSILRALYVVGKNYDYSGVLTDICRSHCENVEWVLKNIPSNYPLAEYYDVNPQQIALLLRLGDGLDIDDRRAPDYMEKLLCVKGYSQTEWAKHTPIRNYKKIIKTDDNTYKIKFIGGCDDAAIYRKVMSYLSYIEDDLKKICKKFQEYPAPYQNVKIDNNIEKDITPKGFEPTELKFSLEYNQVLKLLMGEKIYGSKTAGVRELLQNSIDAVLSMKERENGNPYSHYVPRIIVDINKDDNTLSIYDNGIGMSEDVLENYFFKIGNSFYTTDEFRTLNPKYQAIGHFGIGFLACFMLSQKVTLETMSHQTKKAILMEFEKDSSFVTKRKTDGMIFADGHGTRITLAYDEIIGTVFKNEKKLLDYIKGLLLTNGDYSLVIKNADFEEEIITNIFNEYSESIKADDMDISYENVAFPEIITSVKQLLGPQDFAFYYFGKGKVTDEEYMNHQVRHGYTLCECNRVIEESAVAKLLDGKKPMDSKALGFTDLDYSVMKDSIKDKEGALRYLKIPLIRNRDDYNYYLTAKKGLKIEEYRSTIANLEKRTNDEVSYVLVFCSSDVKSPSDTVVRKMICDALCLDNGGVIPEEWKEDVRKYDYIYLTEKIKVFDGKGNGRFFLPVRAKNSSISPDNNNIYMQGIFVGIVNLGIKRLIRGTKIKQVKVNLHSNEYGLGVSRNSFAPRELRKLRKRVIQLIYQNIAKDPKAPYDDEERKEILAYADSLA